MPSPNAWTLRAIKAGAILVALLSARPYPGAWNDGSRLATVESLVDRGTFAIDDSIFVRVPDNASPYEPGNGVNRTGTLDKLFIDGKYYSDKSPVPAVLLAGVYKIAQIAIGISAQESPKLFCWLIALASSGLAYVVAVDSIHRLGRGLGLTPRLAIPLTLSFALGTVALTYSRSVNNHIMLLGVTAALLTAMLEFARSDLKSARQIALIGTLVGLGYTIDLGIGPILLLGTALWLAFRARSVRSWIAFSLAVLPWLILHHAINYSIAGTIGPANAVPEYLAWPGSPFNAGNMTGHWQHKSLRDFVVYSLDLLLGQRGFLGHNPALFLAVLALPLLVTRRLRERPELLCALFWSGGTFLAYAATSNNYSGLCVSIRWFVPLLAPGYFALALLLRERPQRRPDFLILSTFGLIWAFVVWLGGPWQKPPLALYWPILAASLSTWAAFRLWQWGQKIRSANRDECNHALPKLNDVDLVRIAEDWIHAARL